MARVGARIERWPLREPFAIARGTKTEAIVVIAEAHDGGHRGRGECVPYPRYGESVDSVVQAINAVGEVSDRAELAHELPVGAARSAIDLALWDLEAKRSGIHLAAGWKPVTTARTLVLDSIERTRERAARMASSLLKVKVGGAGDLERLRAVRESAPAARLIVDANEGWTLAQLEEWTPELVALGIELIEQPLPADQDDLLRGWRGPIPICADESCRGEAIESLADRYTAVCLKLDKHGGLSGSLAASKVARAHGLRIMVGCMVSTSLAIAPAIGLAQDADWVDLDGAMLLAGDREPALNVTGDSIDPPVPELWG